MPRADALLVNPTHIAIALRYRKDEGRAPKVTAKGKGVLAEHMRDLAREHGIPIVEDIPLARLLYKKVKVGREIPAATYKAVATILAFVYRATGRGPAARAAAIPARAAAAPHPRPPRRPRRRGAPLEEPPHGRHHRERRRRDGPRPSSPWRCSASSPS